CRPVGARHWLRAWPWPSGCWPRSGCATRTGARSWSWSRTVGRPAGRPRTWTGPRRGWPVSRRSWSTARPAWSAWASRTSWPSASARSLSGWTSWPRAGWRAWSALPRHGDGGPPDAEGAAGAGSRRRADHAAAAEPAAGDRPYRHRERQVHGRVRAGAAGLEPGLAGRRVPVREVREVAGG